MGIVTGALIRIFKLILYLAFIVAFIILIPNLPPYTKYSRIEIESTQPRVGALALNDELNNAQPLYKDKLLGPEAFQIFNDELYTGLATGEIVRLSPGGHVTFVTKIGQPCTGVIQEHICGRPLGFVIDEKNKYLYVADAYYGIWKVNLNTDKKQLLVSPRVPIDGRVPKFFNSVALDKNGDLYWSDSSSDFYLKDGVYATLADPSGRLFQYDAAKNNSKVLLDDLWFPNGLALSPDSLFVVVAETSKYRLIKYYINGPKKGSSEVFVAGLPGIPDNIRALPDGSGILVSLYNAFDDEQPLLIKSMASAPLARKFLARLLRLIEIPFEFMQTLFPNYIFENIVYQIGSFASMASLTPNMAGLVQISWNGNILASYYNTDGSLRHISDAIVYKNKLYTGCPHSQNFIGSVPVPLQLKKAFTVKQEFVKEEKVKSTSPPKNKQEENKESLKAAVPVTDSVKQTTSQPTKQRSTVPNNIPNQKSKQNTVPKDTMPKLTPNEKENKQTENSKIVTNNNKKEAGIPNVIVTESKVKDEQKNDIVKLKINQKEEKLKEQSKDANIKPKTVSQTETKPKDLPQPDTKIKVEKSVDKTSKTVQNETKPKVIPKDKKEPKVESKDKNKSNVGAQVETKPKVATKSKVVSNDAKDSSGVPQNEKVTVTPIVETKPKLQKEIKPKIPQVPKTTEKNEDGKLKDESQKISEIKIANKNKVTKDSDTKAKISNNKSEYLKADAKKPTETENVIKPKHVTETIPTEVETKPAETAQPVTTPKPIPVTENIPSDTAQPNKETLKVIKKSGPQEIRNPNL